MGRIGKTNRVAVLPEVFGTSEPQHQNDSEESATEVRGQIKQMGAFDPDSLPESTLAAPDASGEPAKKTRKPRGPNKKSAAAPVMDANDPNNPMSDPVYAAAVAEMTGFGGGKMVGMPFELWAMAAKNPELRLSAEEQKRWASFWYVISKKAQVDPTSWLNLGIYGTMMLVEQVTKRFAMSEGGPLALKKWFGIDIAGLMNQQEPEILSPEI